MTAPDNHDLARQLAVLEERMNTHKAEAESAIDRLRADMADWNADAAKRDTEAEKRVTRIILAMVAIVALAVAFLKYA